MLDPFSIILGLGSLGLGIGGAAERASSNRRKRGIAAAEARGMMLGRKPSEYEEESTWAPLAQGLAAGLATVQNAQQLELQNKMAKAYIDKVQGSGGAPPITIGGPTFGGPSLMQGRNLAQELESPLSKRSPWGL